MADFLSVVGAVVTATIQWMGEYLAFIVASPPLMFICVCIPIAFAVVDTVKRLIRL